MRFVSLGVTTIWSVFAVDHLEVVDGQADRCEACRNDGEDDQDVKEQKIL
jgi:hypothetical protein